MRLQLLMLSIFFSNAITAQGINDKRKEEQMIRETEGNKPFVKKPLTHADYDRWESISEKAISNNGNIVVYVVNPQEGDGNLYVSTKKGTELKKIPRGYNPVITNDNLFVICKIKPVFKETREARIKKKKPEELPKDSLAIIDLGKDTVYKIAKVKSFKTPEKGKEWVAYLLEKSDPARPKTIVAPDSISQVQAIQKMADSLKKVSDSLFTKIREVKEKGLAVLSPPKKEQKQAAKPAEDPVEEGTDLVLRNLLTGKEQVFKLANEYYFDKYAKKLLVETTRKNGDSLRKAMVLWQHLTENRTDTILEGFNDSKNYAIDELAKQVAFVIEKDSGLKSLQKFYKLVYFKDGMPSGTIKAERSNPGVAKGLTVSPDFINKFSKDGRQLYFGLAPIRKPKDTTLVEFETARLDIWNYKDDYLQPQQLNQAPQELKRSFTTVFHPETNRIIQLGSDTTEIIQPVNEGNANFVLGISSKGNRAAAQWQGFSKLSAYLISTETGAVTTIFKNARVQPAVSPLGNYVYWYDTKSRNWMTYNTANREIKNITKEIKVPLYDEEFDNPDEPPAHGLMGWEEKDAAVFIYDKYDIWKCDPDGVIKPALMVNGRAEKITTRWVNTDNEEKSIMTGKAYMFTYFSNVNKMMNIKVRKTNEIVIAEPNMGTTFRGFQRAKDSLNCFIYTCENPHQSPYILAFETDQEQHDQFYVNVLHNPNPQQDEYRWYNNELVNWKMLDGKMSEGILYKPEDLDESKKYPIIFYFYERDADDLYNYRGPAPSASTINIPYFVSNGYIVFDPNIYYKNGEPGASAYNSVVSAAKYLSRKYKWIDSTRMAIQGQSWGGYQVAYLVTQTNIFKCAGAGAPVSNMTSAYGGIRWGAGISRQFQYEKGQSRIGGTLWDKTPLYLKNSPLFSAPNIKTPLLLMHNDKDGAVPWYQSIEFFSALKRLDKKVWLLQYNDEDHNLVERRNRKDLSVRLAQFFDHYLKGKPMPKWMAEGVPAVEKGIEWGL